MNHEYWQSKFEEEKFVNLENLSDTIGVVRDDLYILSDETTEPLGILIAQELEKMSEQIKYTDSINDVEKKFDITFTKEGLKRLKREVKDFATFDVSIFRNAGTGPCGAVTDVDVDTMLNTKPAPVYQFHPDFVSWIDAQLQLTYERLVSSAYWLATFYNPEREWNYIPDPLAVERAVRMATEGIEHYVYAYDEDEADPTRQGVSSKQMTSMQQNADRIVDGLRALDVTGKAGFKVKTSFKAAYDLARSAVEERQERERERKAANAARADKANELLKEKFGSHVASLVRMDEDVA